MELWPAQLAQGTPQIQNLVGMRKRVASRPQMLQATRPKRCQKQCRTERAKSTWRTLEVSHLQALKIIKIYLC